MTHSTHPVQPRTTRPSPTVVLSAAELVTNLPGLLGYYPHRSLILAGLHDQPHDASATDPEPRTGADGQFPQLQLGPIARMDNATHGWPVENTLAPALPPALWHAASVLATAGCTACMVIVVDDRLDTASWAHARHHLPDTIGTLTVADCAWVTTITAGATVHVHRHQPQTAQLDDPASSIAAAETVRAGRVVAQSRQAYVDSSTRHVTARQPHNCTDRCLTTPDVAALVAAGPGDTAFEDVIGHVAAAAERLVAATERYCPRDQQWWAAALCDHRLRDRILLDVLHTEDDAEDTAAVLTHLLELTPAGAATAEVETLIGICRYMRGDLLLAGEYLSRAQRHDPHSRLAVLVERALLAVVPPAEFHAMLLRATHALGESGERMRMVPRLTVAEQHEGPASAAAEHRAS